MKLAVRISSTFQLLPGPKPQIMSAKDTWQTKRDLNFIATFILLKLEISYRTTGRHNATQSLAIVQKIIDDCPSSREVWYEIKSMLEERFAKGRSCGTSSWILQTKYAEIPNSEEEVDVEIDDHPNVPVPKNVDKGPRRYVMHWNRRPPKTIRAISSIN
ncbi:hypothetical protein AVEN_93981-1 [Araneus ventricosus]|uniref:Uncharacterized protein n=1 Tax=Araneus ventricosus TaxID=182803 RepID=A0A4Y2CJM9_ARAVE|nr:hypothetical protein AVEN_93981-1 [Araneus ventricosus]